MTDYDTLKDILEIAELLSSEISSDLGPQLEADAFNDETGDRVTVVFQFNKNEELEGIRTQNQ